MKITVKADEHNFSLHIPNALVLNRLAGAIACKAMNQQGLSLTNQQLVVFMSALRDYRKTYGEWVLMEVDSSGGEYVQIKL